MASSGVWENVILCKTPTFDGVCGMLFFTNINFVWHNYANCWHICQYVSLMVDGIANFLMLVVTDVIVTLLVVNQLDVMLADVFAMWLTIATLLYGWWCCHCGRWNGHIFLLLSLWQMEKPHCEITDDVVTVADGIATVWMADVVAIVANGISTLLNGWCYSQCDRWNSHICDSWC